MVFLTVAAAYVFFFFFFFKQKTAYEMRISDWSSDVCSSDLAAVLAEARQRHLHLHRRGVLRLVEDDEGIRQRAPAHEGERRHLDLAVGQAAGHLGRRQQDRKSVV